jgi:hypothetical protein
VTVNFKDGRTLSRERTGRRGDPEEPWSEAELIVRAGDILRLAPRPVDLDRLVDWSRDFAAAEDRRWRADGLFAMARVSAVAETAA